MRNKLVTPLVVVLTILIGTVLGGGLLTPPSASAMSVSKCHHYEDWIWPDGYMCARMDLKKTRIAGTDDHCRLRLMGVHTYTANGTKPYNTVNDDPPYAYTAHTVDVTKVKKSGDDFAFSKTEVNVENEKPHASKSWVKLKKTKKRVGRAFHLLLNYTLYWKHNPDPTALLNLRVGPLNNCKIYVRTH